MKQKNKLKVESEMVPEESLLVEILSLTETEEIESAIDKWLENASLPESDDYLTYGEIILTISRTGSTWMRKMSYARFFLWCY